MKKLDIKEVQEMLLLLMKELNVFLKENNVTYYLIAGSVLGAVRHQGFIPWDDDIDIGLKREDYEKFLKIASNFDKRYEVINFTNSKNCDFGLTRIYIKNTYIDNPSISKTKLDKRLYLDVFPLDNVPDNDEELSVFEKKIIKKKKLIQLIDARKTSRSKLKNFGRKIISCGLSPFRGGILRSFDRLMKKYRDCETTRICSLCSQYSFKKQVMPKTIYGVPKLLQFENVELFVPEDYKAYLTILYGSDYMELPPIEKRKKGYDVYMVEEVE